MDDLLESLQREIDSLKKTLEEYGISEVEQISDVEYICLNQIRRIKASSECGELSPEQVKNLDTLNKTLRSLRGKNPQKKAVKKSSSSIEELINIAGQDGPIDK